MGYKKCVYHLGNYVRRTDWMAVGGEQCDDEQTELSVMSESDSADEMEEELGGDEDTESEAHGLVASENDQDDEGDCGLMCAEDEPPFDDTAGLMFGFGDGSDDDTAGLL